VTHDELCIQLAADCPWWTESDWKAFTSASAEEQRALATAMHLSAASPGVDGWKIAVGILHAAAKVVGAFVPGVRTGADAVEAVVKLA
jgi:hypothetical protein